MKDASKLADDLLRGEAEASATLSDEEVAQSRERHPGDPNCTGDPVTCSAHEGRKEIEDTIKKIAAKRKKEKAPEMGEQFEDDTEPDGGIDLDRLAPDEITGLFVEFGTECEEMREKVRGMTRACAWLSHLLLGEGGDQELAGYASRVRGIATRTSKGLDLLASQMPDLGLGFEEHVSEEPEFDMDGSRYEPEAPGEE